MSSDASHHNVLEVYHGKPSSVGGAPTSLYYFLEALDRSRYEPILLCHMRGDSTGRFGRLGIPILYHRMPRYMHFKGDYATLLGGRKWLHLLWSFVPDPWIVSIIRKHDVRLVHLHSAVQVSVALTSRRLGIPVVWHVRECIHNGVLGIRRRILESAIRHWSDAIICISEDEGRPFSYLEKTHIIYNSVNFSLVDMALQQSRARIRNALGLDAAMIVVGMAGPLYSIKGIYDLVEAAGQVLARTSSGVKFLLVGPSGLTERYERDIQAKILNRLGLRRVDGRTEMETLVREKGLQPHFIFLGPQADALEYIAAMDIILFPSHLDALGRPALEASALGKPIIATSRDRLTRVVKDGETGILVPPQEPARLADAILRLLNNPAEMTRLGQAGFAYAREHFDSRRNADQIMAVYDQVLTKN